ncbi:MAG: maleylpyruvate isomerase family mycothiol-dependent enzyme [Trebonia sp.]
MTPDRGTRVYDDLEAEQDQLDAVLGRLGRGDWGRPSAAAGWSVSDVVLHLAQTEELVVASAQGDPAPFARDPGQGGSVDEFAARRVADERGADGDAVYQRWRTARHAALDGLRGCPPGTRLPWATSPLAPATLATTRLAEHWAHALDITGPLGVAYPDTARLRHIAWLAVRTLPYALEVAGLKAGPVRCELTGPDGERWEFGPADAESRISGAAGAFCRVAARRLAAEASGLTATGPDAAAALRVVRTYA